MECSPRKNGRNPNGFEILLIHGFPQSHLSWSCQFGSKLAHIHDFRTGDEHKSADLLP
jgi:pimeloyl-ACP methyl ester carboxylesterase